MSEVIARFERDYLEFHNISPARRHEMVRHLKALEARTGVSAERVEVDALRAYITELSQERTPATIAKIVKQIRPFYTWAWEEAGLIDAQRMMEVRTVRAPRGARQSAPNPYSRHEIGKLWTDWDRKYRLKDGEEQALWYMKRWENGTSPWWRVKPLAWRYQARAIICLGMMGGLRRNEIYNLALDEMHYDAAYVVATTRKTADGTPVQRAVPWTTPQMREAVRDWLDLRDRIQPGHDRPWLSLFSVTHIRTPLPYRSYQVLMSNLGRGWKFHRLRHTAATEMLRAGYPLETVQKVMGHASLQQTLSYAQLLTDDVVRVAGKCEMQLSSALDFEAA